MGFDSIDSIDPMKSTGVLMDLIAKKQKAIGENLANLDTPGYERKDVDFGQYLGTMGSSLETKLSSKYGAAPVFDKTSQEEINPANELMALQKNSLLYTMATRRMSNIITEMKTVINVGK
jgi:flagellar basal-body rod protein FlgB